MRIFQVSFCYLILSLSLLWSENILCIISLLYKSLRFVLWLRIYSNLLHVSCVLEKNVHPNVFGKSILSMSTWKVVWKHYSGLFILIYFLSSCSVNYWERNVGICDYNHGFICFSFNSNSFRFVYFEAVFLGVYTFSIALCSWINWSLDQCAVSLFISSNIPFSEAYYV